MRILTVIIFASLLACGCDRNDGRGANSPGRSSQMGGEKGISSNFSATGSPLGPLGATGAFPNTIKTGTTLEVFTNVGSSQPINPPRDPTP